MEGNSMLKKTLLALSVATLSGAAVLPPAASRAADTGVQVAAGSQANPRSPCAPANPCAANPCAANPCAANPCAPAVKKPANPRTPSAANPCAANPCAANPCAANPCAANPCAPQGN